MTRHRYPLRALRGDLIGAGFGTLLAGGLLPALRPGWAGALLLGGLAALFLGFFLRTLARAWQVVEMTPDALHLSGPGIHRTLPWDGIKHVGLRYFTTRRDRSGGWLVLTLRGAGTTIGIESLIDGFDAILARAAAAARANGATMTDDTAGNLSTLGMLPADRATGATS